MKRRDFLKQTGVFASVAMLGGRGPYFAGAAQAAPKDFTSAVPHFTFADTLAEQEIQLKDNLLIRRFEESRQRLGRDRHRPVYHFVSPESWLNDPNGLCYWQNRWHLFYQAYPPEDPRQHWGHAVSDDLVHWRDLPYAIYPHPEERCFSGSTLVEQDRVIAMYHGRGLNGNMVAVSSDPLLLNWEKLTGGPVIRGDTSSPYAVFDPCIWKKDGVYYSLSGRYLLHQPSGQRTPACFLFRSRDLVNWEYLHQFIEGEHFARIGDDGACPYFWPIGDRHILFLYSHVRGGQAFLGDYDKRRDKFVVTSQHDFNFGAWNPGGVHAPSAAPDGQGGVIVLFNMNEAKPTRGWNRNMTLAQRLTLIGKDELGVEPAGNIEALRFDHKRVNHIQLPANKEVVLETILGSAMEIEAEIAIDIGLISGAVGNFSPMVEMNILRSPDKQEFTRIAFFHKRGIRDRVSRKQYSMISIDSSYSSLASDVQSRPPETAPVYVEPNETLKLRVFVDKSVVEVFVNGKQCLAMRVYPERRDSTGVSLRSQGRDAVLKSLDAWQMRGIHPS